MYQNHRPRYEMPFAAGREYSSAAKSNHTDEGMMQNRKVLLSASSEAFQFNSTSNESSFHAPYPQAPAFTDLHELQKAALRTIVTKENTTNAKRVVSMEFGYGMLDTRVVSKPPVSQLNFGGKMTSVELFDSISSRFTHIIAKSRPIETVTENNKAEYMKTLANCACSCAASMHVKAQIKQNVLCKETITVPIVTKRKVFFKRKHRLSANIVQKARLKKGNKMNETNTTSTVFMDQGEDDAVLVVHPSAKDKFE